MTIAKHIKIGIKYFFDAILFMMDSVYTLLFCVQNYKILMSKHQKYYFFLFLSFLLLTLPAVKRKTKITH